MNTLSTLPSDLQDVCLSFLDYEDLTAAVSVNKDFSKREVEQPLHLEHCYHCGIVVDIGDFDPTDDASIVEFMQDNLDREGYVDAGSGCFSDEEFEMAALFLTERDMVDAMCGGQHVCPNCFVEIAESPPYLTRSDCFVF